MLNDMMNTPRRNLSHGKLSCFAQGKRRVWLMKNTLAVAAAIAAAIAAAGNAQAAVLYSGGTYEQNFDGLPHGTNPLNPNPDNVIRFNNAALISNGADPPFPGGWKDDTDFDGTNLGIKGWYLRHNGGPLGNGGVTGHAQVRYGNASPATPSAAFYVFTTGAATASPDIVEKALGILSSDSLNGNPDGRAYIGLQLINDTGKTLDSFTITYDGEQYRDRGTAGANGFDLQWSLSATAAGWASSNAATPGPGDFYYGVNGVERGAFAFNDPDLSKRAFMAPHNGTSNVALDGNLPENSVRDITHTVTGINWAPGAELWIRWRDQLPGTPTNFHGIAIDNVRFSATAVPEPSAFLLLASALLCCGWRRRAQLG